MYRMVGFIGVVVAALAAAPVLAETGSDREAAEGQGRYEGVAASDNAIWVVDRQTGRVRRCVQDFAGQPPDCSAFSK